MWQRSHVAAQPCTCGNAAVWQLNCVGAQQCGSATVWQRNYMGAQPSVSTALWGRSRMQQIGSKGV